MTTYHYLPDRDDELMSRCMAYVSEHTGIGAGKCQDVLESYIEFWAQRPALFNQFMATVDPNHLPDDTEPDDE